MSRYSRSKSRMTSARRSRVRKATSSVPGYDNLGWDHFGHPASAEQPDLEEYGIDSDFGEEVRQGPYEDSPAPASYSWEPDHPAHSKKALKNSMERKAAKCIRIAESRLGKFASQREVEDLALRFMDLPNSVINARVASVMMPSEDMGHMSEDVEGMMYSDDHDLMVDDDGMMAEDMDNDLMADMGMYSEDDDLMAMEDDLMAEDDDLMAMDNDLMADMGIYSDDDDLMAMDMYSDDDDLMAMEHDLVAEDVDTDMDQIMAEFYAEDVDPVAEMQDSIADTLTDEVAQLKAANARLARKVRSLSRTVHASKKSENTEKDSETTEEKASESTEEKASESTEDKVARIERLANALADYMAEMEKSAADEEAKEEEAPAKEESKKAYNSMADILADLEVEEGEVAEELEPVAEDPMGLDSVADLQVDARLASIFTAGEGDEEVAEETEAEETEAEETEAGKKASYRPSTQARQASVKTLGNISREASSSDELSKLWESAPDVSKFFG